MIGFGGAPLGNMFAPLPEAVAAETVRAALDAGVRSFDTAPHYGAGLSELRMGAVLRQVPRDSFSVSTKVGRVLVPASAADGDQGFVDELPFRRVWDYSAAGAERSLAGSFARLGLSRVDHVFIHDCAEDHHGAGWRAMFETAMAGAAPYLAGLKRQGVIAGWGLGVNRLAPCLAALERDAPDVLLVAGRYTLLDQSALAELFPACARRGTRVVLGGPYNSGLLAGGATFNYEVAPPALAARAQAMGAVCARHGVGLKAAALQFCAAHPVVTAVIPGARSPAEVRENALAMAAPIPGAVWAELRQAGLLPPAAPVPEGR